MLFGLLAVSCLVFGVLFRDPNIFPSCFYHLVGSYTKQVFKACKKTSLLLRQRARWFLDVFSSKVLQKVGFLQADFVVGRVVGILLGFCCDFAWIFLGFGGSF